MQRKSRGNREQEDRDQERRVHIIWALEGKRVDSEISPPENGLESSTRQGAKVLQRWQKQQVGEGKDT